MSYQLDETLKEIEDQPFLILIYIRRIEKNIVMRFDV